MNEFPTCGLWPTGDLIAASVLAGDGSLHRIWMAPTDPHNGWDCLTYLERDYGLDLRLVIPDNAATLRALARSALHRDMTVLFAPEVLVEAIGALAFSRPRPRHYANLLARLPDSRFRSYLRPLPPQDPLQLPLL